jgi:hypothetical protein
MLRLIEIVAEEATSVPLKNMSMDQLVKEIGRNQAQMTRNAQDQAAQQ